MPEDEDVVRLLTSIDRRLALLTATQERDLRRAFEEEILKTPQRVALWGLVDGQRAAPDIVKETGGNLRVTQKFVKEMLDAGFLKDTKTGTGTAVIAEHDQGAVLRWFVTRGDAT
ncbi:MAG: hypothetical protein M3N53_00350 [Actinomycetota bacterium]|nr:hypothetical protein [Actinomycetota bacterium]